MLDQATSVEQDLGALPEWDLKDLYPGPDAPGLGADLERAARAAEDFHARYAGRIAALDGAALGTAIAAYERIEETLGRVMSFAQLYHAGRMEDPEAGRFLQMAHERVNAIATQLLCLTLEINRIEDDALAARMSAPALARYGPWVRDVRAFRPHQLSDELERLLHEKQVTGRAAWTRLFDETIAAQRFEIGGRRLVNAEALDLLSDKDAGVRRAAAKAVGQVFAEEARVFGLITNNLAKDKEIEDRWRGFARPISSRNLTNRVEDSVVDALIEAVSAAYPDLSHRYYRLKARWLGVAQLDYWDRNAPLPEDDARRYPWEEAKAIVLSAYRGFSSEMASLAERFFHRAWLDATVRPGKAPGAFSHPTVPSAHPYILLNYLGRARDVMTLAHELGHGVHQLLAAPQGVLMAETPLTLAETASVFGEQLTFRAMLDAESRPERRRVMLATRIEDMLNTVVRQVAFCEFERRVHEERRSGELTPNRIGEVWMATQEESLGPAFRFDSEYRYYWTYIPHFIHAPFYVYAYAFGECLVTALYAVYQGAEPGFQGKYLDMLRAGGTLHHKELLAPFGLDASERAFWSKGLSVVSGLIDELEEAM